MGWPDYVDDAREYMDTVIRLNAPEGSRTLTFTMGNRKAAGPATLRSGIADLADARIEIHPATPERWPDLVALFGPKGACAGCWCQYFKQTGPEFAVNKGEKNRARLETAVARGERPGLIAYVDGAVAAWCAVERKSKFSRIMKSRSLAGSVDTEAWAVPCFFTGKAFRGLGLARRLAQAAFEHGRTNGASIVEGYPAVPTKGRMPDTFAYYGTLSTFTAAGYEEVRAPSASRRVVARSVEPSDG
ncbi:MAG: GNAT family N-acetyltransferase [Deltaproteobacteria bacterium]|nr:GNAT family N-acetyltransferase [Deltaproteobacteria bacterium]